MSPTNFRYQLALALLLCASVAQAAIITVTTAGQLTTALGTAVAGDEIVLANGTYSGAFVVNGANGTAALPITIRALNRHQAILLGDNICSGQIGLDIYRSWYIIKDLIVRDYNRSIWVRDGVSNVTITHNLIDHFWSDGIRLAPDYPPASGGVTNVTVTKNVVAFGEGCSGSGDTTDAGIYLVNGSDSNTVRDNIILATGDNGYQAGSKNGYGGLVAGTSDNNTVQGNLFMMNGGKGVFRILADDSYIVYTANTATGNLVRDNAFLWGEGGISTDDCGDDANSFLNNLMVGNYFNQFSTKGQPDTGGIKGHHTVQHNTFYVSDFSRSGVAFETSTGSAHCDGTKQANTLQNNLFYAPSAANAGSGDHFLLYDVAMATNFATVSNNLFWANSATNTWTANYTTQGTDILATGSPPVFTNATEGDFSLAGGSPGKSAASDGLDMGMSYNFALKKAWVQKAFALPTQQQDNLTTSAAFTVDPGHYYAIWFWIPTSPFNGTETFTVEGDARQRNIATLTTGGTWTQPGGPARWITLGRQKAADGTLNITWVNATSASKIFIRQIPTAAEAYQWIVGSPSQVYGSNDTLIASTSNVTNGSGIAGSEVTWNSAGYLRADCELNIPSFSGAPTAGAGATVWFLVKPDGTNYEDGGASVFPPRRHDLFIPLRPVSTAQRITMKDIPIPVGPVTTVLRNDSGVTFQGATLPFTLKCEPKTFTLP